MNFSITINGEGAELNSALKTLREIMDGKINGEGAVTASIQPQTAPVYQPPVQQATPEQVAAAYQAPQSYTAPPQQPYTQPPVQPVYQAPAQQQPLTPAHGVVPTSAPSYSLDQLGVACGPLVDAGRGPELTAWIQQRGAAALTQLDRSYYGEFANYIRSLGAKI